MRAIHELKRKTSFKKKFGLFVIENFAPEFTILICESMKSMLIIFAGSKSYTGNVRRIWHNGKDKERKMTTSRLNVFQI